MKIKLFLMDVDGTLTDGKIYMGKDGEVLNAFNIKDGLALHEILPEKDIIPIIITGRTSKIVENRARELGILHVNQGVKNKKSQLLALAEQFGCGLKEMAYIGDDLNDIEVMQMVGVSGCPSDAAEAVIKTADFVSVKKGGEGAVRDFIEWLIKQA